MYKKCKNNKRNTRLKAKNEKFPTPRTQGNVQSKGRLHLPSQLKVGSLHVARVLPMMAINGQNHFRRMRQWCSRNQWQGSSSHAPAGLVWLIIKIVGAPQAMGLQESHPIVLGVGVYLSAGYKMEWRHRRVCSRWLEDWWSPSQGGDCRFYVLCSKLADYSIWVNLGVTGFEGILIIVSRLSFELRETFLEA